METRARDVIIRSYMPQFDPNIPHLMYDHGGWEGPNPDVAMCCRCMCVPIHIAGEACRRHDQARGGDIVMLSLFDWC